MFRLYVCLCIFGTVFGQLPYSGKCPEVNVKQDFNTSEYLGRWFEMKRMFAAYQMFSDCVTAEYTPLGNGVIQVNNTGYDHAQERWITAIGDALQMDAVEGSKLGVLFPGAPSRGNYWVLDTDYVTYSVVWSCSETSVLGYTSNTQNTWILTRTPEGVDADTLANIEALLEGYKLPKFPRRTNQICPGRNLLEMKLF